MTVGPGRMNDHAGRRQFMIELARASGDFILPLFGRKELPVEQKRDNTPVTRADKGAEELMR